MPKKGWLTPPMPLVIKVLDESPTREVSFDDDPASVCIGRDPERCQVVLPPDLIVVGREHCELRRIGGRYRLFINASNPVWLNGRRLHEDAKLDQHSRIRLGDAAGPELLVHQSGTPGVVSTLKAQLTGAVTRAERLTGVSSTVIRGFAVGAAALGLGLVWHHCVRPDPPDCRVALERIMPSVYLVFIEDDLGREHQVGTAFAVERGTLATNAHVAESFASIPARSALRVRSTGPGFAEHDVLGVEIHPGYAAFARLRDAQEPGAPRGRSRYDVALLRVSNPDALGEPLVLASDGQLRSLKAGGDVVYAGYPTQGNEAIDYQKPVPFAHVATISSVTDYCFKESSPAARTLLQHTLKASGGASGSPIADCRGRVVGILSGGNVTRVRADDGRLAEVVQGPMNYGQRIDLVTELLEDEVDEGRLQSEMQACRPGG